MDGSRDDLLDLLIALGRPREDDIALDVAVLPSLAAFAVAPMVDSLVAIADGPEVLEEGQRLATEIGVENVEFCLAELSLLPFADDVFSLVLAIDALRVSSHPSVALGEMRRVTRSGGRVVLMETVVDDVVAGPLDKLTRLREPAHQKYFRRDELEAMAVDAGLTVGRQELARYSVDLEYWAQTAGGAGMRTALVKEGFMALPIDVQVALDVAFSDGAVSFSYDVCGLLLDRA